MSTRSFGWAPIDVGVGWARGFTGTIRLVQNVATPTVEIVDRDVGTTWDDVVTRTAEVEFRMWVEIEGIQATNGYVARVITVDYGPDDQTIELTEKAWDDLDIGELEMSPDAARRLPAALAEARDGVEKLAGEP